MHSLTAEDTVEDAAISLQFVKYQNVQNITVSSASLGGGSSNYCWLPLQLFIQDNQGQEETTVIHHLAFFGSPLDSTKMSDFKRVAGERGERHS